MSEMSSSHQLPPLLNQPAVNTESGNTNGCPRRSDLLRQLESPTQATGLPNGSASSLQTPGLQDSRRGSLSSVHNIPSDRPEPEQLRTPRLSFHLNASVQPLPNGTRSDTTEDHLRQLLPPVRSLETIRRRSSRDLPPQPASNLSQYDVFSNNWTTNLAPPDERLPPFSTVVPRPSTIPRLDTQSHQTSTQSQSSLNHILSASSAPSDQQRVMELTGTPNYKRSWSDRQMHQNAIRRSLEMYDMSGIMDDVSAQRVEFSMKRY